MKVSSPEVGIITEYWFEGGQMPLQRRVPKFGFKNPFRVEYKVLNLDTIQNLIDEKSVTEINHQVLADNGIIASPKKLVKVLGRGELSAKVDVKLNKFSQSAKVAIENAGGTVTEV
ncbi:MAG: 50S ribosomal protein L15 [Bacteroidia bacterium]